LIRYLNPRRENIQREWGQTMTDMVVEQECGTIKLSYLIMVVVSLFQGGHIKEMTISILST